MPKWHKQLFTYLYISSTYYKITIVLFYIVYSVLVGKNKLNRVRGWGHRRDPLLYTATTDRFCQQYNLSTLLFLGVAIELDALTHEVCSTILLGFAGCEGVPPECRRISLSFIFWSNSLSYKTALWVYFQPSIRTFTTKILQICQRLMIPRASRWVVLKPV